MKTFVIVSLYLFVALALGGILKPFATDARYRSPGRIIAALIAGAWVAVTLISAAVLLTGVKGLCGKSPSTARTPPAGQP